MRHMCAGRLIWRRIAIPKRLVSSRRPLDHPGIVFTDPVRVTARIRLGRTFAMSGDKAKAKAAYQDFLALWKNADSDIPILRESKAEYAKLQ